MKRYGNKFKLKSVFFTFISPKIVNREKNFQTGYVFSSVEKFTKNAVVSCFERDIQPEGNVFNYFLLLTSINSDKLSNFL